MKAAVLFETGKPLEIVSIDVPELKKGQVLVKVAATGLCHTQLSEIRGKRGVDKFLPHTLGHEASGIVEAIGDEVTLVKPGDHVILSWIKGKGINAEPPVYFSEGKKINSGPISTFSTKTVVAENRLTAIDNKMPLDIAALIGCAVATGMGAVINNANLKGGESVIVYGAGGIGLLAIHAASIKGASIVVAVDVVDMKLEMAKEFGATHTINSKKENVAERVKEITENKGFDYAIESAGRKETMEQAFKLIKNGGKTIIVGNLSFGQEISIDPFALICGKRIVGSWGGETVPERDYPYYVDLYLSGKAKFDKLITHRFKLEEINKAFDLLERGEVGRAIIEF